MDARSVLIGIQSVAQCGRHGKSGVAGPLSLQFPPNLLKAAAFSEGRVTGADKGEKAVEFGLEGVCDGEEFHNLRHSHSTASPMR